MYSTGDILHWKLAQVIPLGDIHALISITDADGHYYKAKWLHEGLHGGNAQFDLIDNLFEAQFGPMSIVDLTKLRLKGEITHEEYQAATATTRKYAQ